MEIEQILRIIITGLLLGGLYALIAMGLSLQYGVARIFNISHGEFIMVAAIAAYALYNFANVNPFIAIVIAAPAALVLGFVIHILVFKRMLRTSPNQGAFESNSMLASFGLLFIIQNLTTQIVPWGSAIRSYSFLNVPVGIGDISFGANRLVAMVFALAIGLAFYFFLTYTRTGKAIRAAAQDATTAGLMGINISRVLALCFGIGAALAAVAGVLLSMVYPVHVNMGLNYTVIAIIVIVLGGLGSIPGAFVGGLILGLMDSVISYFQPGLTMASFYLLFIVLLLTRPKGLFGK